MYNYTKLKPIIKNIDYPRNLLLAIFCWNWNINVTRDYAYSIDINSIVNDKEKLGTLEYVIYKSLSTEERIVVHGIFRDKLSCKEIAQLPEVYGYYPIFKGNATRKYLKDAINTLIDNKKLITLGLEEYYREQNNISIRYNDKLWEDKLDKYATVNIISKRSVIKSK